MKKSLFFTCLSWILGLLNKNVFIKCKRNESSALPSVLALFLPKSMFQLHDNRLLLPIVPKKPD